MRSGLVKPLAMVIVATIMLSGCRRLGFSNRVLLRVPSPDERAVAVCQEIPELDGPSYDVRAEKPDGTRITQLLRSGDGDPCSEIAWSPDGRYLAVLSAHVARVRFVDVTRALQQPRAPNAYWSSPQLDFSREGDLRRGTNLRFIGPLEAELTTCSYDLRETQRTRTMRCISPEQRIRFDIPAASHASGG